jgi:hypothetical protein
MKEVYLISLPALYTPARAVPLPNRTYLCSCHTARSTPTNQKNPTLLERGLFVVNLYFLAFDRTCQDPLYKIASQHNVN